MTRRWLALLGMALGSGPALAEGPAFAGQTGLFDTPTAEVLRDGTAAFAWNRSDSGNPTLGELENYNLLLGFLPGLEVGGRIAQSSDLTYDFATNTGTGIRDLSFNAKYSYALPWGAAVAVGAQDLGGKAQHFRTRYAVATVPWRTLAFTAGYGFGPDVLDGAFGGIEWRPWRFVGLVAEHDTEDFNGGIKLLSPELWGARIGAMAAYRGGSEEVEYGAHVEFALGGKAPSPARSASDVSPRPDVSPRAERGVSSEPGGSEDIPRSARDDTGGTLRDALARLGFESIRVGLRAPATQVVGLENRVYNHSAADGIGVALGAIASRVGPEVERIELTLFTYGVPQVTVTVPAALYRDFLADPDAHAAALRAALDVRISGGIAQRDAVQWDGVPTPRLQGSELVVEPLLRTFTATEFGLFDYSVGARLRFTAPLARGALVHLGGQVPLVESDDFRAGGNFSGVGVESGLDLALVQYAHKLAPQWTWLWSAGRSQVFQTDLDTLALEQFWLSDEGSHQWRVKLMALHAGFGTRTVALAGYTWFDPTRDYSVGLTGGRFYAEDSGVRVDFNRYFGDTIVGLFFKAASRDDQAVGIQFSLPLTPQRDMTPRSLQLKGARRWGHSISTTVNSSDQRNPLRPILLYEPMLDMDLRRDWYDSGRLGGAYLRDELPRMREAWESWGQ